jgi:AcrR family transcriptional regulator
VIQAQAPARNRNPEQTLDRLTQAALALFGQFGYERTTIDRIVSQAGLSKGAFYNHFASKEEFFIHLLEERVRNNQKRIQTLYGQETDAARWLTSLLQSLLSPTRLEKQWAALSIEFMVQGMRDDRLGSRLALIHDDWRRVIAAKLRDTDSFGLGQLAASPETIAAAVVAMIDGFIIQASMEPDLLNRIRIDQLVEQLVGHTAGEDG